MSAGLTLGRVRFCDTRSGCDGLFSPPADCPDYAAWLAERYRASQSTEQDGRPINYGLSQEVHALVEHVLQGGRVMVIGNHDQTLAEFLCEIVRKTRTDFDLPGHIEVYG